MKELAVGDIIRDEDGDLCEITAIERELDKDEFADEDADREINVKVSWEEYQLTGNGVATLHGEDWTLMEASFDE